MLKKQALLFPRPLSNCNPTDTKVVISGAACWLPGNVVSPPLLQNLFQMNKDVVTLLPDFDSRFPCGYMPDFPFEFKKFGVKLGEAKCLDPQQQLNLFVTGMAVDDYLKSSSKVPLTGPRTGVYFGAWNQDFQGNRDSAYDVIGSNPALIPARISAHFDFRGPSILVNTACASGLECVVRAIGDIRLGRVDHAIVGGVNVIQNPEFTGRMGRGGFLGPSGRCKTWEAGADGYVRSEGCVVFVLSRKEVLGSESAPETTSSYYAEILGGASNHNGANPLISAPNSDAQAELIRTASKDAGIDLVKDYDAIECHGTGTKIGDPLEVNGITKAFNDWDREGFNNRSKPLYLGSAKANIGHLESAAGVVGLLRAVFCLQNQTVYGNPHLAGTAKSRDGSTKSTTGPGKLNPGLKFPKFFRLDMTKAEKLPSNTLKVIGISSAGFGGSNAHVVIGNGGKKVWNGGEMLKLPDCSSGSREQLESEGVLIIRKQDYHYVSKMSDSATANVNQQNQMSRIDSCSTADTALNNSVNSTGKYPDTAVLSTVQASISEMIAQSLSLTTSEEKKIIKSSSALLDLGLDSMSITDLFLQVSKRFGEEWRSSEEEVQELVSSGLTVGGFATLVAKGLASRFKGGMGSPQKVKQAWGPVSAETSEAGSKVVSKTPPQSGSASTTSSTTGGPSVANSETKLLQILAGMGYSNITNQDALLLDIGMDSMSITDFSLQVNKAFGANLNMMEDAGDLSCRKVISMLKDAGCLLQMKGTTDLTDDLLCTEVQQTVPKVVAPKKEKETLESFDYYLTRPLHDLVNLESVGIKQAHKRRKILTTHVGSLPASFGKTSFDHIYQQIDIGLDLINDGEINRSSYVDEVLHRLSGFGFRHGSTNEELDSEWTAGYVPLDVAECPDCAKRFMGKSSLITVNKRFPARNPACIGKIEYEKDRGQIREYLADYTRALKRNGTGPEQAAFYSVPSPGTLALFFKNTGVYYKTQEEYLDAIARAVGVEYKEILDHGFHLQIDCPDLAMGRHLKYAGKSDREFIQSIQPMLIKYLNLSIEEATNSATSTVSQKSLIERIRVHICWGNYGFSHHRDIGLEKIVENLNKIQCGMMLIENANPRHNHEIEAMGRIRSDMMICLGCVDTSSPHVENPNLVAKRLCKLAQLIGPERVVAGTDCGFATTAEANANTEIVFMKLRSLILGAKIASSVLFNGVSLFNPRAQARIYWFGNKPQRLLPNYEIRHVPEHLDVNDVARHMQAYTEIPVFFVYMTPDADRLAIEDLSSATGNSTISRMSQIQSMLQKTAAYPADVILCNSYDRVTSSVRSYLNLDFNLLKLQHRYLAGTRGSSETASVRPDGYYDVVIVGAGLTGLHVASEMQRAGINFCLLEKDSGIGGIWRTYANARSQVNTSEAAYRLVDKAGRTNKDHSTTREILSDAIEVANTLGNRLFLQAQVERVEPVTGLSSNASSQGNLSNSASPERPRIGVTVGQSQQYRYRTTVNIPNPGSGADCHNNNLNQITIKSRGVIFAINDRVGVPREVRWKDEDLFKGEIRDGFSNDAADLDWVGKKVVIVGMGAFATENLRTALECGASSVTILCKRHGTVCPKYIDYVNFVNKGANREGNTGATLAHDSITNTKNMITWRDLYEKTGAKMPECWMGSIKHYGHTISVSDIWFVAHHLRVCDSVADEISHFVDDGIITENTKEHIKADIVIRCTGFERNCNLIPKLTPFNQVNSANYLAPDAMYLADALIDDNVFNSVFGSSVMEMAKSYASIFIYFWKNPREYEVIQKELKQVDVSDRKWSDYIQGLELLCSTFAGIRELALDQVDVRQKAFLDAHTVGAYLKENRREWNELHNIMGVWSEETAYLPYPKWGAGKGAMIQ